MIVERSHLETTSFDHVRKAAHSKGSGDPFIGFVATTIHANAGNVSARWLEQSARHASCPRAGCGRAVCGSPARSP
mgnify:CR=1 FL=1